MILFFFFNDTATTEIYTLSLHDALPICLESTPRGELASRVLRVTLTVSTFNPIEDQRWTEFVQRHPRASVFHTSGDRKSTRLNSSHLVISYAVFCLKKKNKESRSPYTTA